MLDLLLIAGIVLVVLGFLVLGCACFFSEALGGSDMVKSFGELTVVLVGLGTCSLLVIVGVVLSVVSIVTDQAQPT